MNNDVRVRQIYADWPIDNEVGQDAWLAGWAALGWIPAVDAGKLVKIGRTWVVRWVLHSGALTP